MKNLILDDFLEKYGNSVYGKWNAPSDGIYIGRGSKFGNPYPMENKSDEERIRVILLYKQYLAKKVLEDEQFRNSVKALANKNLVCFCSNGTNDLEFGAKYCHGHVLKAMAVYLNNKWV